MSGEADLPQRIYDLATTPVEDMILAVLRDELPEIDVFTLIPSIKVPPYFLLVRGVHSDGVAIGDNPGLVETAPFSVHAYAQDQDGDTKAAVLAKAVWSVLLESARVQKVYPGIGHITQLRCTAAPTREADWATSAGPVQYADLPTGYFRYEAKYRMTMRPHRGVER